VASITRRQKPLRAIRQLEPPLVTVAAREAKPSSRRLPTPSSAYKRRSPGVRVSSRTVIDPRRVTQHVAVWLRRGVHPERMPCGA
jgi:hypothetical protein